MSLRSHPDVERRGESPGISAVTPDTRVMPDARDTPDTDDTPDMLATNARRRADPTASADTADPADTPDTPSTNRRLAPPIQLQTGASPLPSSYARRHARHRRHHRHSRHDIHKTASHCPAVQNVGTRPRASERQRQASLQKLRQRQASQQKTRERARERAAATGERTKTPAKGERTKTPATGERTKTRRDHEHV